MHSLLLLPDHYPTFSPIYTKVSEYLMKNYAVIYGAEGNPSRVIMKMREHEMNVGELVDSHKLVIIDKNRSTLPLSLFSIRKGEVRLANTLVASRRDQFGISNKSRPKRFAIFLSPPDALLRHCYRDSNNEQQVPITISSCEHLIDIYDRAISNLSVVEIICCYTDKTFRELGLSEIIGILDSHKFIIRSGWKQKAISRRLIVELVERGIDKALGTGTCSLIFKTLRLVYNMDAEDSMFMSPHRFETILSRIIGNRAGLVVDSVKQEIVSDLISYDTSVHVVG